MTLADQLAAAQKAQKKQARTISARLKAAGGDTTAVEAKPSKYGNIKATSPLWPGVYFDSRREMRAGEYLKMEEQAGRVRCLQRQVKFPLVVNDEKIGHFTVDFTYHQRRPDLDTSMGESWVYVVADAKAPDRRAQSRDYVLRKKLLKALYGYSVVEM